MTPGSMGFSDLRLAASPFGRDGKDAGAVGDPAAAAGDDASDREASLGIVGQGRLAHLLFNFELPGFLFGVGWDGFVDVGRHRDWNEGFGISRYAY